jgi:hypothetical protein
MAVTTMELLELLRKVDGGDIDFLREGVRVLAQALMDAEVSAQIGAEHGQRTQPGPPTATATGPGTGTPGSARSTCRSPGSVRGAICPASWSRAGAPSGRWPRSWPSAMWRACRPGGSRTSPRRWHHQPVEVPGLPGLRRARRARGSVAQPAVGRRPVRVRMAGCAGRQGPRGAAAWSTPPRWSPPVSTPTGTARSSAWSWAPPRTVPPGRASCGAGRPRPVRGQAGGL